MHWGVGTLWVVVGLSALRLSFSHRFGPRWVWVVVAALCLGFGIDTAFQLRFALTDLLRGALRATGGEEAFRHRRVLQVGVIVGLLLPLAIWSALRLQRVRGLGPAAKLAALGVGVELTGLTLETVSWHYFDQYPIIYQALRAIGFVLTAGGVGWAWKRGRMVPDQ